MNAAYWLLNVQMNWWWMNWRVDGSWQFYPKRKPSLPKHTGCSPMEPQQCRWTHAGIKPEWVFSPFSGWYEKGSPEELQAERHTLTFIHNIQTWATEMPHKCPGDIFSLSLGICADNQTIEQKNDALQAKVNQLVTGEARSYNPKKSQKNALLTYWLWRRSVWFSSDIGLGQIKLGCF